MATLGALAQGVIGVIVDEVVAQGGRRVQQQREEDTQYRSQQQQQQIATGPLASLTESATMFVNRTVAAVVTGLQYLLLLEAVLLSAVVLYGALYWLLMPLRLHDKPIFFDYSNKATAGGATGTVDFLAQHTQWDPSPLTNVGRLNTKVLKAGQHYKVGLELQMPTSYTNRRVGVFMVYTTLLDAEDNELATSARPAMLPHTSALRKGLGMFFSWPLHLVGLRREADTVYVDCMDFYEENEAHPLTKARVAVSSGRVQFYKSSINITPQLKGLPWLMQHWFYSTLAAGILFIASLELMIFGFFYVFFFLDLEHTNGNGNESSGSGSGSGGSGSSEKKMTTTLERYDNGRRPAAGAGSSRSQSHNTLLASHPGRIASTFTHTAGGGSSSGGGRGSRPPANSHGDAAAARASVANGPPSLHHDDGLRQRKAGPVAAAAATAATGDSGTGRRLSGFASPPMVENATWTGRPSPAVLYPVERREQSSTLPPGVLAYQRGARYVIQPGGSRGGRRSPTSGAEEWDVSGGEGTGADGGGGRGGNGDSVGGAVESSVPATSSQEKLDAAALASWVALGGGSTTGCRRGGGRGAAVAAAAAAAAAEGLEHGKEATAQGVRVVGAERVVVAEQGEIQAGWGSRDVVEGERVSRFVEAEGDTAGAVGGGAGLDDRGGTAGWRQNVRDSSESSSDGVVDDQDKW